MDPMKMQIPPIQMSRRAVLKRLVLGVGTMLAAP
jgi:hypothetical protein